MNLSDRMKRYEQTSVGQHLVYRCPAVLRVDGRAFHSFTRGLDVPWDTNLLSVMTQTAVDLCAEISTARFAYGQSDEISILLIDYNNLQTEQWFGGKVQKIVSVAASVATAAFNNAIKRIVDNPAMQQHPNLSIWKSKLGKALFDARVFSIPNEDVVNYFIWRQQDAIRNSVSMLGRSKFSHSQLSKKNCDQIKSMLIQQYNTNWDDCNPVEKRGWCVYRKQQELNIRPKWHIDLQTPVFTQSREYIEQWCKTCTE